MHQATILSEVERYRRWSTEQQRMICLEAFADGACVRHVARKYELNPGQLYKWRRLLIKKGDPPGDYGIVGEFLEVRGHATASSSPADTSGTDLDLAFLNELLSEPDPVRERSRVAQRPTRGRERRVRDGTPDASTIELCLANGRSLGFRLTDDLDLGRLAALADLLERTR